MLVHFHSKYPLFCSLPLWETVFHIKARCQHSSERVYHWSHLGSSLRMSGAIPPLLHVLHSDNRTFTFNPFVTTITYLLTYIMIEQQAFKFLYKDLLCVFHNYPKSYFFPFTQRLYSNTADEGFRFLFFYFIIAPLEGQGMGWDGGAIYTEWKDGDERRVGNRERVTKIYERNICNEQIQVTENQHFVLYTHTHTHTHNSNNKLNSGSSYCLQGNSLVSLRGK
jgi:hypothetical protein